MNLSRRRAVAGLVTAGATALSARKSDAARHEGEPILVAPPGSDPQRLARDERFWGQVARQFRVNPGFTNLENGYYGIMPAPVLREYERQCRRLNEDNSYLLRGSYKQTEHDRVRARVADVSGVAPDEIALTRCGTEALQNLIAGYNRLRPGDAVMYCSLDYHSAIYAMNWLKDRRGVDVIRFELPEPHTRQAILDHYARQLREHPRVKLLLLTHMNNRTGLVSPVAELVAMSRQHSVDTIVDAGHSFGQLDFRLPDLGADFVACCLHKWIHAPLGSGFLYIRSGRLPDIDPCYRDESHPLDSIRSRVHSGTMDIAPFLTLPAALELHEAIGVANKQARLRHLRDRWVHQARHLDGIDILTPEDPLTYGAITAFRVRGRKTKQDNEAIARYLMDNHRIFTVPKGGMTAGDCIRVTPALFTTTDQVDELAEALIDVARKFRR
ncbi:aminotransferase class V-fold PLP-dependent enzyme [Lentzea sp. BCCO 10_0061]|uniref:Aminotransferase class V-fold PLP-dependent enzyme n=1 Tax=Lentzea sokolovensis TaxID=3095429 RepID=A0ABU4UUK2_9PSEU|nr:aminotransferase class V-fold PLP-dependent enzyme [Lentzea sp. BCCO 10_0061]MDX8143188.1 aminotransferase class V-fold PLP-dependent enzyme [Lentzea sp. BCCO 10_0061]